MDNYANLTQLLRSRASDWWRNQVASSKGFMSVVLIARINTNLSFECHDRREIVESTCDCCFAAGQGCSAVHAENSKQRQLISLIPVMVGPLAI